MYLGELVEKAPSKELFRNPIHPYTKALLQFRRQISEIKWKDRLEGEITSPINPNRDVALQSDVSMHKIFVERESKIARSARRSFLRLSSCRRIGFYKIR